MDLDDAACIQRAPSVLGADVGDLHVLLSEDLRYLGLDAVGRRVWELIERPQTMGQLVSVLTGEYEVDTERCRADVARFVGSLAEHHLVVVT